MKYNMNKYFAYVAAIGFFVVLMLMIFYFQSHEIVILAAVICFAELMSFFAIFRSYIVLEPKRLVIYAGLAKKAVPYENIEYIKETRSMVAISRSMCFALHNLGIRVKGPNIYGMDYLLVSVQNLDDFLGEIEATQPGVQIIRKNT